MNVDLEAMTRDQLIELKQDKWLAAKVLREEMLAITAVLDVKTLELKKQEREAAAGNPDATSATIVGVAAEALGGVSSP